MPWHKTRYCLFAKQGLFRRTALVSFVVFSAVVFLSKSHIDRLLEEFCVHKEPVRKAASGVLNTATAVGAYRLVKRFVPYVVLRLDRIALHIKDILLIYRHEQLHFFLCRVGVISYRKTGRTLVYNASFDFFSAYAYKLGFSVAAVKPDVVVILERYPAEIRIISERNEGQLSALVLIIAVDIIAVLCFKMSDIHVGVVSLENLIDIDAY